MRLPKLLSRPVRAGKERWDVKCGTDPLAASVTTAPVSTTIAALIALPAPHDPTIRTAVEMAVYAVPCTIVLWKVEADGDHHLVLKDDAGNTMIGEIPDPRCIQGTSAWQVQIAAAHAQFDAWPRLNKPCIVTGVCFMDRLHGQTGVAGNGIELHPVLSITAPSSLSAVSDTP